MNDGTFHVEEIVQSPLPGYGSPTSICFSFDDSLIAFLFSPDNTLSKKVFVFDLKTGKQDLFFSPPDGGIEESNISTEETLRRERSREQGLGVIRYEWVKTSLTNKTIMVPLPAGVYFQELGCLKPVLELVNLPFSPIIDPRVSPDGTKLAYVRDFEVHVLNRLNNEEKRLTDGADGINLMHGLAEYIAQEEMDRRVGYWWSLDSKYIAYTEVDCSDVPSFRIMHQGASSVGPDTQEDHAYPFAGALNVRVRLGVVSASGGPTNWMDLLCGGSDEPNNEDEYLARVNWMPGNGLAVQVLNRSHTKLKVFKFDIKTGQSNILLVEESDTWINLHDCFTPLDRSLSRYSGGFIWASERSGYRHLYLHDINGSCLGSITEGSWMVEQIMGVDEVMGLIYFMGTMDGPLESNLYRTRLNPFNGHTLQRPMRLTLGRGKHSVVLDHHFHSFIDVHDSLNSPPRVSLCSLIDGNEISVLYEQAVPVPRLKELQIEPPEFVSLQANDGITLYGLLYRPDISKYGPPPYKCVISVYGGPSVQLVHDSWINTVDMRAQYLRSRGILVWKLDNRGTARRGLNFEGAIKHRFGHVDTEDQVFGTEWLVKQGLAKPKNIGVYGWSYGGYLSAMLLARFPEVFRCAVSGAPVTTWDGYDTFYTEKYMGFPSEDPERYEKSSLIHHAPKLSGRLLLIHGMIDENVHFRHTARFVNALVETGKLYELLIFPDARHMPRERRDRIYMEQRIWEFIDRSL